MTASRKRPGVAFWSTVVVVGAVLYVLSSGPALWIAAQFDSEAAETCLEWIYMPLWLSESTLTGVVGFVAICIWLTVRIVNRRERWAKWMLAGVIAMPIFYVVSFGPACWMTARPRLRDFPETVHLTMTIFWPLGRDLGSDSTAAAAFRWWAMFGVPDGYVVLAPQVPNGTSRFAIKKGGGPVR